MRRIHLLDKNRSRLSSNEIYNFRNEITKQKNSPVCADLSTNEVAKIGAAAMKTDKYRMAKGQINV